MIPIKLLLQAPAEPLMWFLRIMSLTMMTLGSHIGISDANLTAVAALVLLFPVVAISTLDARSRTSFHVHVPALVLSAFVFVCTGMFVPFLYWAHLLPVETAILGASILISLPYRVDGNIVVLQKCVVYCTLWSIVPWMPEVLGKSEAIRLLLIFEMEWVSVFGTLLWRTAPIFLYGFCRALGLILVSNNNDHLAFLLTYYVEKSAISSRKAPNHHQICE